MKFALVCFKIMSRPINNNLKKVFQHRFHSLHHFIGVCGQKAHEFEIKLNRRLTNTKDDVDFYIKPLSKEAAFNKGVEYFTEFVFFYGVLFALAYYEIQKSHESSQKQKNEMSALKNKGKELEKIVGDLREEVQKNRLLKQQQQEEIQELKQALDEIR